MANRRMFSKDIVQSDRFLDMSHTAQLLYFHLGIEADDDGFVTPLKIMRMASINADDLKILEAKQLIIKFQDGVIVIRDWKKNNEIRGDRYHETQYIEHKNLLTCDGGTYRLVVPMVVPAVPQMDTEVRLGKVRLGKVNQYIEQQAAPVSSQPDQYSEFIELFNTTTNRKFRSTDKSKKQFLARIKEGFTLEDIGLAIKNCMRVPFHKENPQYLTPEFITRADKLQQYLNFKTGGHQEVRKLSPGDLLRESFIDSSSLVKKF